MPKVKRRCGFVRKTISIPTALYPWAVRQSREPEHANSLSAYVRKLILSDLQRAGQPVKEEQAAA